MNKDKKQEIIDRYSDLSYKLGKLPSKRESHRLGLSNDIVRYYFQNHTKLKEQTLLKYPELVRFQTPSPLSAQELENYRLSLETKKLKGKNNLLTSNVSTLDYIAQFADKVFKGRIKPTKFKKSNKPVERVHTLVLSDLHFGADIKSDETGAQNYGSLEEARRFACIIKEASNYKPQYRDKTKLKVLLLGDIIENSMHDERTGATIAEQVSRAIHLLIQGVAYLATKYNTVEVECSTGNHDRNTKRHKERAIHEKWDSLGTIIYYSVKQACSKLKNVTFNIPKTPLASYTVFGKRVGYTHGDTVINPGNPGSSLNISKLENQVNKLNAALPDKDEYQLLVYGHTHTAHIVHLSNGTVLLGNGCLPPPDPFAVSIGITEGRNCGQWIFESVKDYLVGDLRFIKVSKDYMSNDELNNVIEPWQSF